MYGAAITEVHEVCPVTGGSHDWSVEVISQTQTRRDTVELCVACEVRKTDTEGWWGDEDYDLL